MSEKETDHRKEYPSLITHGNFVSPLVMEFLSVKSLYAFSLTSKYHYYQVLPNEIQRRKKQVALYETSVERILSKRKKVPLGHQDFYEAKRLCKRARLLVGAPPRQGPKRRKIEHNNDDDSNCDWLYKSNTNNLQDCFCSGQMCCCCQREKKKYDPFFQERMKMVPKSCDKDEHQPTLYMLPDCFYISPKGDPLSTWIPTELTLALLKNMALTIWSAAELTDNSSMDIFGEQLASNRNFNVEATKFRQLTKYQALPFSESEMTLFFFRVAASDIAKSNIRAQICLHDVIECADTIHAMKDKEAFPMETGEYYFDLSIVKSTMSSRSNTEEISDISDSVTDDSMSTCSL